MKHFTTALALGLLVSFSWPVPAQSKRRPSKRSKTSKRAKPTKLSKRARRSRAKRAFRKAEIKFSRGRFEKALVLYDEAYRLLPLPGFLFNIGQCHRMRGRYTRALFFFERFLALTQRRSTRRMVRRLVKQLKAMVAARKRAAALAARTGAKAWEKAEATRKLIERERQIFAAERLLLRKQVLQTRSRLTLLLQERAKPKTPVYRRWWFWTVIGSVVATAVGVGLGVTLGNRTRLVDPSGTLGTLNRR